MQYENLRSGRKYAGSLSAVATHCHRVTLRETLHPSLYPSTSRPQLQVDKIVDYRGCSFLFKKEEEENAVKCSASYQQLFIQKEKQSNKTDGKDMNSSVE